MAIIRTATSINMSRLDFYPGGTVPAGVLELGSHLVEPFSDSYSFTWPDINVSFVFAGDLISDSHSNTVSEIDYHLLGGDPSKLVEYEGWSIEEIAINRSQADALLSALAGGDVSALDTLLRGQLTGSDTVYLADGSGSSVSTYEGDDVIYAGGGNSTIDAGAGNDVIDSRSSLVDDYHIASARYIGGKGNDTYILSSTAARVIENAGEGTDLVQIADPHMGRKYVMTANVENATMTNTVAGVVAGNALVNTIRGNDAANDLYGAAGADKLWGQGGADRLNGGLGSDQLHGGLGNDRLTGGDGADRFFFETQANGATNHDTIVDFVSGSDSLVFSRKVFAAIGAAGNLAADAFWAGAGAVAAHDATDRVVYDTGTGNLYYDADGIGGVAAVLVAQLGLTTHPAFSASDILIVA